MKFYKNFIRTFNDLPKHNTLLIHSLAGCNLHCFNCHNYDEVVAKKLEDFFTEEDIINQLSLNGFLFDAVIFSGGEFLLEDIDAIAKFLAAVRKVFKGKIIINTNGSFPEKIRYLLDMKLVDGFHIDMKLPYHVMDIHGDEQIYKDILGIKPSQTLIDKMLTSINLVVEDNNQLSQVRTVKYPILGVDFFVEIKNYINILNEKYNSNVSYNVNEFINS